MLLMATILTRIEMVIMNIMVLIVMMILMPG